MTVLEQQRISLEGECELLEQMSSGGYGECSVLAIPATIEEWLEARRTARKRARRAEAFGYDAHTLAREEEGDSIFAINTSRARRQGRPMSSGYLERHEFGPLPVYPDARHAVRTSGVWSARGELVAYLVMIREGELALVSQILGHGEHEDYGIMYLLFRYALEREIRAGAGWCVYNRHDSGTDGLRFLKERLGFAEVAVEWAA